MLLREAAGRICVANSHRLMLSKDTLRFDKIAPSSHKIKLPGAKDAEQKDETSNGALERTDAGGHFIDRAWIISLASLVPHAQAD